MSLYSPALVHHSFSQVQLPNDRIHTLLRGVTFWDASSYMYMYDTYDNKMHV